MGEPRRQFNFRPPGLISDLSPRWPQSIFPNPNIVIVALELVSSLIFASVLVQHHWPREFRTVLIAATATALGVAALRFPLCKRLPAWALHIDLMAGIGLISLVVFEGEKVGVHLANLYMLLAIFVLLYVPLGWALAEIGLCGIIYAFMLAQSHNFVGIRSLAWLQVFGTIAIMGIVVGGLIRILDSAAKQDSLTGLANRRLWDERVIEEVQRAQRYDGNLALVIIDLDNFKALNDSKGHHFEDEVLRQLGEAWQGELRKSGDFLARLGGDEFGLVIPDADEVRTRKLVNRLLGVLPAGISASFGIATLKKNMTGADLIRAADERMYRSKRQRRQEGGPNPA